MDLLHMSMTDALAHSQNARPMTSEDLPVKEHAAVATISILPTAISPDRLVARRASKACHNCRAKKIKCSLVKSGNPCNTCQLDEVQCVVPKSRRNKGSRVTKTALTGHGEGRNLNAAPEIPAPENTLRCSEPSPDTGQSPVNRSYSLCPSR